MCEFSCFIDYLHEFEYPNISYASEKYVEDIFSTGNRQFLLTWILKQLNSKLTIPTEWSQSTQNIVADILVSSGFCSSSEKLKFVAKDLTLSNKSEINIFTKIFTYMQNSKEKINPDQAVISTTTADLEQFLIKKTNLFPNLKAVKLRSEQVKQDKVDQLKDEIAKLKTLTEASSETGLDMQLNSCEVPENTTEKKIEKFRSMSSSLNAGANALLMIPAPEEASLSEPGVGRDLPDLDRQSRQVLKYFQDTSLLQGVDQHTFIEKYDDEMKEVYNETVNLCNIITEQGKMLNGN